MGGDKSDRMTQDHRKGDYLTQQAAATSHTNCYVDEMGCVHIVHAPLLGSTWWPSWINSRCSKQVLTAGPSVGDTQVTYVHAGDK